MKKFKITDILIGILFTLFFTSIGVIAAVNFRFIYYLDIFRLNISETSGYTVEAIIENYNTLIDYNSPFFKGDLIFPSMIASANGLQHFVEVKQIFTSFYYIALATFILCLLIVIYKAYKRDKSYLVISSITVLVLPSIVGIAAAFNFDKVFILFHKIAFQNDYWLFDPQTDPVITILQDTYFLHCLIVIIVFLILCSLILFLCSKIGKNKRRTYYRHR